MRPLNLSQRLMFDVDELVELWQELQVGYLRVLIVHLQVVQC